MIDLTFSDDLLSHICANMKRFDRRTHDRPDLKKAAVAITIIEMTDDATIDGSRSGRAAMILTRRSPALKTHAGQWALPGGRMERGESAEDTVLRELAEEVGLTLGHERIIGRLDDYSTRSGFTIKPIVLWGGRAVTLAANPDEVAAIHQIPLMEFMRNDAPIIQEIPESENPVLLMPVGNDCIAAPTAAIIYQFREVALLGRNRRVAHYEQPHFAWQ